MPLGANKAAIMGVAGTAVTGDVVLINSITASGDATVTFSSGIDSTYYLYTFGFYNINPATDDVRLQFQVNATDGADYNDSAITSTYHRAYHREDDVDAAVTYVASGDLVQATTFQALQQEMGNGADESTAGFLHLWNPSSTTYIKHFQSRTNGYYQANWTMDAHIAGYINDTTAIDDIQFKFESGNFDGVIKMWGTK